MKKQSFYKFSLEQLVVALVIISLTFTQAPKAVDEVGGLDTITVGGFTPATGISLVTEFTLRFIGDNFSQHSATQFLINGIFSKAQAAEVEYQAEIIEQSNYVVNILPDKGFTFSIKIKNTGSKSWPRNGSGFFYIKSIRSQSQFQHDFWLDNNTPIKSKTSVAPGETVTLKYALQAPPAIGLYVENFALAFDNNTPIQGSMFELPINVTLYPQGNAPRPKPPEVKTAKSENTEQLSQTTANNTQSPPPTISPTNISDSQTFSIPSSNDPQIAGVATSNTINSIKQLSILETEPDIRVGLYWSPKKLIAVTADGEFTVFSGDIKQGHYGAGTIVRVQYISGVYNLILPSGTASFSQPLVFKPLNESTILELPDYERRVGWNTSINDNRFKGNIEIKYNPRTGRLWAINELPFETYVAGIDETSNIEVPEFHKTLAVAARTYALFHLLDNTRYRGFFHVDDNNDQIYRGYNASRRLTLYVAAAQETAGQVITLNNEVVVTPYFTQSNGQTKSYQSVWGNGGGLEINHLQTVSVPQDVGRTLLGHGVGMSAQGAKRMAELDGLDYQTILKHFYSGVDISKVY